MEVDATWDLDDGVAGDEELRLTTRGHGAEVFDAVLAPSRAHSDRHFFIRTSHVAERKLWHKAASAILLRERTHYERPRTAFGSPLGVQGEAVTPFECVRDGASGLE
jgi:hypothetical protein